eukprot:2293738-Rhodomonas_salina.1
MVLASVSVQRSETGRFSCMKGRSGLKRGGLGQRAEKGRFGGRESAGAGGEAGGGAGEGGAKDEINARKYETDVKSIPENANKVLAEVEHNRLKQEHDVERDVVCRLQQGTTNSEGRARPAQAGARCGIKYGINPRKHTKKYMKPTLENVKKGVGCKRVRYRLRPGTTGSSRSTMWCAAKIPYKKPHFQYKLYQAIVQVVPGKRFLVVGFRNGKYTEIDARRVEIDVKSMLENAKSGKVLAEAEHNRLKQEHGV